MSDTPLHQRWIGASYVVLTASAALSMFTVGCAAHRSCTEVGAGCGGVPNGTWIVSDACQDPLAPSPLQPTYSDQPATTAREAPPARTSGDWCSSLHVETENAVTKFTFPTDSVRLTGGTLTFADDASYDARLNLEGNGRVELSAACISQFGARPSCSDLATGLAKYAAELSADPPRPSYTSVACMEAAEGACSCTYAMSLSGSMAGRWSASGSVLTIFDPGLRLPSQIDYCVAGDQLTMSGHNGTTMFNPGGALSEEGQLESVSQVLGSAGMRILTMHRM